MNSTIFNFISPNFNNEILVNADKSISHRAVILSSLSCGNSKITNLLISQDVQNTMNCFTKMGVEFIKQDKENNYIVNSKGFKSFNSSKNTHYDFYMGNSGTSTRLLCGILCSNIGVSCTISGDNSLSRRPMKRIINPLKEMGANISANQDNLLPITISPKQLKAIDYNLEIPSAQVKSCLILAGLFAQGTTKIAFKEKTRDHTENMLKNLGVDIKEEAIVNHLSNNELSYKLHINPIDNLNTYDYEVPADFSSASFFIVATLISKDSKLLIKNVNLNPLRCGLLHACIEMGAKISIENQKIIQGELCGDLFIQSSELKPINLSKDTISTMIDEFPIYFVLCSFINGKTAINNLHELRVKESDRLKAMVINLQKVGIEVNELENGIEIFGKDDNLSIKNVILDSFEDHRVAMSLIVMGLKSIHPLGIKNCENINTSFPDFIKICKQLNFNINNG
jgi:3-phosphoshikimate 1-carboxyvinyltransferase